MDELYELNLAGLRMRCRLQFAEAASWLKAERISQPVAAAEIPVITCPPEDRQDLLKYGMEDGPGLEASVLAAYFSEAMLPYSRVVLHGVALRWQGKAYLICAPSGVGKSTQAKILQQLCPGAFGIICGDRPILQFCHSERSAEEQNNLRSVRDSGIMVHPSPWNGKEDWHGADAAPLAGLILLERGERNKLEQLSPQEAALKTFIQMIHPNRSEESIRLLAEFTTRLLDAVPIWRLTSNQVPESTRLLLQSVFVPGQKQEREEQ